MHAERKNANYAIIKKKKKRQVSGSAESNGHQVGGRWHTPLLVTPCQCSEKRRSDILEYAHGIYEALPQLWELLGAHRQNEVSVS